MDYSEDKLIHLNKILKSIRNINQLIVYEKDVKGLIEKTCEILVRDQGYLNTWIVIFPDDNNKLLFAKSGIQINFEEMEKFVKNGELPQCARKALISREVVVINDPLHECSDCFLLNNYSGKTAITTPIRYKEKIYGIISVSTSTIPENIGEEQDLFSEMSKDLGYKISSIENDREKKRAFAQIKNNKEKYQRLFDSANDMVYLHEIDKRGRPGRILEANEQAIRKMGYTEEEFRKLSAKDLMDPDFKKDSGKITDKINKGENIIFESSHITKNGDKIPVEISLHSFVLTGKNEALSVVRDISERKKLEDELILTINATTEGIWKRNFITGKTEYGPRCYTMLGYRQEEFPSEFESWIPLIHPEDREKAAGAIGRWLKTKIEHFDFEFRLKTKDGRYRWIHTHAKTVEKDKDGNLVRIIGTRSDITEKKEQEEALKITEFSVDNSPISIFWIKPDGSFFYANKAACTELGYSEEELLNLRIDDVDPDYPFEKIAIRWNEIKERKTTKIKTHHKSKNGLVFPVEVTTYYLNYKGKEFEISNAVDITQRNKAEKAVLKSETKYRELFNNVSEAVFLHKVLKGNKRGHFEEVNDTTCRRLGYTRDELLKMTVADINTTTIRKDDLDRVKQLRESGSIIFEGEHVRKNGSVFPVFVKATMIDIDGEKFILSLVRDISKEKENHQKITESLKQIEKNLFQMAALNDNIRNPLSVIMGYVALEEGENMEILLRQVKEIDEIINQLDKGWLESQKIRKFLKQHYSVELNE